VPDTDDDFMPIGGTQASRGNGSDIAETNDGDGAPLG
jgi:hypothetical protein